MLQKWNKFLESGEVAAHSSAEENKGIVAVVGYITSADNARNGSVMCIDTDFELSEKRNEGNVDILKEI